MHIFNAISKTRVLTKVLLTSVIVLPITTTIVTSFNDVMASDNLNKVDLTSDFSELVNKYTDDNIKIRAKIFKDEGKLKDGEEYWALDGISNKDSKWSKSIETLKKLIVFCSNCSGTEMDKFKNELINKIKYVVTHDENNNECEPRIDNSNEKQIFGLINCHVVANGLFSFFNDWGETYKNDLTRLFFKATTDTWQNLNFIDSDISKKVKSFIFRQKLIDMFDTGGKYENYKINEDLKKYFEGDKDVGDKELRLTSFLKHDWDCYLTQFGVIRNIEDKKNDKITGSVERRLYNMYKRKYDAIIETDRIAICGAGLHYIFDAFDLSRSIDEKKLSDILEVKNFIKRLSDACLIYEYAGEDISIYTGKIGDILSYLHCIDIKAMLKGEVKISPTSIEEYKCFLENITKYITDDVKSAYYYIDKLKTSTHCASNISRDQRKTLKDMFLFWKHDFIKNRMLFVSDEYISFPRFVCNEDIESDQFFLDKGKYTVEGKDILCQDLCSFIANYYEFDENNTRLKKVVKQILDKATWARGDIKEAAELFIKSIPGMLNKLNRDGLPIAHSTAILTLEQLLDKNQNIANDLEYIKYLLYEKLKSKHLITNCDRDAKQEIKKFVQENYTEDEQKKVYGQIINEWSGLPTDIKYSENSIDNFIQNKEKLLPQTTKLLQGIKFPNVVCSPNKGTFVLRKFNKDNYKSFPKDLSDFICSFYDKDSDSLVNMIKKFILKMNLDKNIYKPDDTFTIDKEKAMFETAKFFIQTLPEIFYSINKNKLLKTSAAISCLARSLNEENEYIKQLIDRVKQNLVFQYQHEKVNNDAYEKFREFCQNNYNEDLQEQNEAYQDMKKEWDKLIPSWKVDDEYVTNVINNHITRKIEQLSVELGKTTGTQSGKYFLYLRDEWNKTHFEDENYPLEKFLNKYKDTTFYLS